MSVISGPVALYSNVPIEPQNYVPWRFEVTNVVLGRQTTVTVNVPSITSLNYMLGQLTRLLIPPQFGCRQLNNVQAYAISVVAPNTIILQLDSSVGVDSFTNSSATTKPQIIAIGDINSGQINSNGRQSNLTYVPGSFRNVS